MFFFLSLSATGSASPKMRKYPGGKYWIYRYTLTDKQDTPYSLDHPGRWLSRKSVERRRKQGLALDSTDLPVSPKYVRQIEKTAAESFRKKQRRDSEWEIIGTSRWNNTLLLRSNDTTLLANVSALPCIAKAEKVWESPDSVAVMLKQDCHQSFNVWDSIKGVTYGNGKEQIEMLSGHNLHRIGHKGKGVTIAVLDGGFQNADMIPAILHANMMGAKDFVFPNSRYFYQETDHGTKVQPVEEDYWAIAAEYADSLGADIISSSLGYNEYDDYPGYYHQHDLDGQTSFISHTASMLAKKGIILVNSAGNSGMGPWKKITFPADAYDILTVGALNTEKKNAPFSGVGPTQDGRVKPDVMALGSPTALISGRGTIVRDMGTSFSTPVVAGLVACLWQALPELTALEIIQLIRESSSNYQKPDNVYGYGTPNFWRAYMIGKMKKSDE